MLYEFTHVMLKVCDKLAALSADRPDPYENLKIAFTFSFSQQTFRDRPRLEKSYRNYSSSSHSSKN